MFLFLLLAATLLQTDQLTRLGDVQPFWLSAEAVKQGRPLVASEGKSSVSARAMSMVRAAQRRQSEHPEELKGPCLQHVVSTDATVTNADRSTWEAIRTNTKAAYVGQITQVTQGFLGRTPSSLLTIGKFDVVFLAPGFPSDGSVYVAFPTADFVVGQTRICNSGPIPPFSPAVGDRVLVMGDDSPIDSEGRYLPVVSNQLVFERNHQIYSSAPGLANTFKDLDEIVDDFMKRKEAVAK